MKARRLRRYTAAQERQALEADHRWQWRETRPCGHRNTWPRHLATMERIPPPEPHRDQDALRELLGQSLMARDFDRQVAELQVRVAELNGYTALGVTVTEVVG